MSTQTIEAPVTPAHREQLADLWRGVRPRSPRPVTGAASRYVGRPITIAARIVRKGQRP